jgi:hypothetical protein
MSDITAEMEKWFSDKQLTLTKNSGKFRFWQKALERYQDKSCDVLEVGSYEGRSAIVFLELLPKCQLTAIDVFANPVIEARFDSNLSSFGARICKIKARAAQALDTFLADRKAFDVIFIDTGKRWQVAYVYSSFVWPLLNVGGTLIWDDLKWRRKGEENDLDAGPGWGIAMFVQQFSGCLEIEHAGSQLIVRKTKEWPNLSSKSKALITVRRKRPAA